MEKNTKFQKSIFISPFSLWTTVLKPQVWHFNHHHFGSSATGWSWGRYAFLVLCLDWISLKTNCGRDLLPQGRYIVKHPLPNYPFCL